MKFTPLYNLHLALGAEMITTSAGYRMPARYRAVEEEHKAVRERVGMMDISLMGRIDIKGKDALEYLQKLAANDASKLSDGQLLYTTFCNEQGNIMDDLTVWRFGKNHFRIVTSSVMRYKTLRWLQDHLGDYDVYLTDISPNLGMISVQGPRSRELLEGISDIRGLKFFHFAQGGLKGIPSLIARVGFSGELGYECYFGAEDTVEAWNAIQEAGKEFDLLPYGFDVLDSLRFEKGYIFYGYEVTSENNPFECGLEKWIAFEKGNFIGREALLKIREAGAKKKLAAMEIGGDELISEKQSVRAGNKIAGETVYGFKGLTIGKNIAWAWLDSESSRDGQELTIENKGRMTRAKVVPLRNYDPKGRRMRS
jgi:aminomethyltransferase